MGANPYNPPEVLETLTVSGTATFESDVDIQGTTTLVASTSTGKLKINKTDTEALLVNMDDGTTGVFGVDTLNSDVMIRGDLDTFTATAMNLGGSVATSLTLGRAGIAVGVNATFNMNGGSATNTGTYTGQGQMILDLDSTEAFLVRKNSEGGDVFTVDSTNSQVEVNSGTFRTTFDDSNYFQATVGSDGTTTLSTVGTNAGLSLSAGTSVKIEPTATGTGMIVASNQLNTTNNTETTILPVTTPTDSCTRIVVEVVGIEDDGSQVYSATMYGTFKNDGGTASQIGSTYIDSNTDENPGVWGGASFVVSSPNVVARVTGATSTNITWMATAKVYVIIENF